MSGRFHIKDDFKSGAPITQIPVSWFNAVARRLNNLIGGYGIRETDEGDSAVFSLAPEGSMTSSAPVTHAFIGATPDGTDSQGDQKYLPPFPSVLSDDAEVTQSAAVLWTAGSGQGADVTILFKSESGGGVHEMYCAQLVFNQYGILQRIEAVEDGGVYING